MEKKSNKNTLSNMDRKQKKELAEEILASFDDIPAMCPECGEPTKDEWCITVRRTEYPDGFDIELGCKICDAPFPSGEDVDD